MAGGLKLLVALVLVSVAGGGKWVGAQVHHVVGGGGDGGWNPSSGVSSSSSGIVYRVGDKIWFKYTAAQDNIVEVKSKEEYEACDVSNPIRMYTDGSDGVPLEEEGIRYFASKHPESCKNGLKLHVEVQPHVMHHHIVATSSSVANAVGVAEAPTIPSASTKLIGLPYGLLVVVGLLLVGL